MLPRLAGVLTLSPALVLQHLDGYGKLAAWEFEACASAWRRRLMLTAVGIGCLLVSVTLTGTAAMLWASASLNGAVGLDLGNLWTTHGWVLVAVPLLPMLVAIGSFLMLASGPNSPAFATLRTQLQLDAELLRELAATGTPRR